jgi:hypothetical protein
MERILLRKFGYKTNHHTLKRFLEPYETPIQLEFDLLFRLSSITSLSLTYVLSPLSFRRGVGSEVVKAYEKQV